MNVMEANTLTNQTANVNNVVPPKVEIPNTVESQIDTTDNALAEGGETTSGVSEKVQWLTLFIVGLTVVSLVMNIVSNKKQMERLEKEDADVLKKLKEHDLNLKRALGKKYESLD